MTGKSPAKGTNECNLLNMEQASGEDQNSSSYITTECLPVKHGAGQWSGPV